MSGALAGEDGREALCTRLWPGDSRISGRGGRRRPGRGRRRGRWAGASGSSGGRPRSPPPPPPPLPRPRLLLLPHHSRPSLCAHRDEQGSPFLPRFFFFFPAAASVPFSTSTGSSFLGESGLASCNEMGWKELRRGATTRRGGTDLLLRERDLAVEAGDDGLQLLVLRTCHKPTSPSAQLKTTTSAHSSPASSCSSSFSSTSPRRKPRPPPLPFYGLLWSRGWTGTSL